MFDLLNSQVHAIRKSKTVWITAGLSLVFLAGWILETAEALPRKIALHPPVGIEFPIHLSPGSMIEVHNEFEHPLVNLRVLKESSGKRLVHIQELLPGENFGMEFTLQGTYWICYGSISQITDSKDMCLQLNVGGLKPI